MSLFQQVTIIGFGLIGSSMARGLRKHGLTQNIVCGDFSQDVCTRVLELKLADQATTDLAASVRGSDLVIVAVPVGAYGDVAKIIIPAMEDGAILTDTGSVKRSVVEAVRPHLNEKVHFVPGHPIAGTENSGPEAGFAELFEGRWTILTPLPDTDIRAVEKVTKLWEGIGAVIEIMDAHHHDLVLGITSHLPHLIAYTIVGTATDLEDHLKDEVISYSAGGFRDFTRIAASNPVMWRDIMLHNKDAVLELLQRFNEDLTELQKAIRNGNGDVIEERFVRTRDIRRKIIDAGQGRNQASHHGEGDMLSDVCSKAS